MGHWPGKGVPEKKKRDVEYAYREGMDAVLNDHNIDAVVAIPMLTDETGVPPSEILDLLAQSRHLMTRS